MNETITRASKFNRVVIQNSYAWLGETVGGLVTLLTLVIAVVIVWKKNAESVGRILTALQSLLQEKVTRFVGFSLREKILLRDCHALRVEYPLTEKARKFTFRRRTRIETRERIRRINPWLYKDDTIVESLKMENPSCEIAGNKFQRAPTRNNFAIRRHKKVPSA